MKIVENDRFGRNFGRGTFLGDDGDAFFELSLYRRALMMGWSHACPVIDYVIREYGGGEEGQRKTLARYGECNFMTGVVWESAQNLNPKLWRLLASPVTRTPGEHAGTYELDKAPTSHEYEMSPLSTPWGYAIPRVLIEAIRNARLTNDAEQVGNLQLVLMNIIDEAVLFTDNPMEFAVILAEKSFDLGGNGEAILSHLLSPGILKEENCAGIFEEIFELFPERAPGLLKLYNELRNQNLLAQADIIDFPINLPTLE